MLIGCGDPPPETPADPTADPSYRRNVEQLTALDHEAENFFKNGKPDDAAARIQTAEPLSSQVLGVPRPTLAAMEAASDLDDLYGRMLLSNRHYEWAQFQFQKNLARWKYWKPQTPDTARRMQEAEAAIAECDRGMGKAGMMKSTPGKRTKSGKP